MSLGVELIIPTLEIIKSLNTSAKQSYDDKKSYEEKLESAEGRNIYK